MKDEDCIFCKIISGQIPADKVYEDSKVIAFLDIHPVNPGHTLVVPKNHSRNILEDNIDDLTSSMSAIRRIAGAVIKAVKADGFNLGVNTNAAAGQAVFHTHFHVIPRFINDGLRHWPQKDSIGVNETKAVKMKIIENLAMHPKE